MITASPSTKHTPLWQCELARAVSDPAELLQRLKLDTALLPSARRAARLFPLRVPQGFIARMKPGDAGDPLLRQVLPLDAEFAPAPGFAEDPVGDRDAMPLPGVLHKYRGRVLLIATGACAVHCRYCFRRHFPYSDAHAAAGSWAASLDYIARDTSIREVILSGGDPLSLNDRRLQELVLRIEAITHVQRLRIHTRYPVVLPERIDDALLAWLRVCRLKKIVVIHANHANEIDVTVVRGLERLALANTLLLNQSVLLRGVNDSVETLSALSETLFAAGVLPYYLHQLDKVRGAAHFEVSTQRATQLARELNALLPGYLVPRLVTEQAGAPGKLPVDVRP
jgi:EF-P beta-lysylation protein EpmB